MVELLIDYADKNNIILELNKKDRYGNYPFLKAKSYNNTRIVELLTNYSPKNNISLNPLSIEIINFFQNMVNKRIFY